MHKFATGTLAVLLGATWMVAPALAQTTTDKAESKTERAKEKAESAIDKVKEKTGSIADKTKEKVREGKEKVKEKMGRPDARMEANDVRDAQQALRDKGHDPGRIDGVMGPRTAMAVRSFQKAEGLTETGQLDAPTMEKLGVAAGSASPRSEEAPAKRQSP